MIFELPTPHCVLDLTLDDGAISYVRQHGNADSEVRLFFSHGNGFAIDGYFPFWNAFLDRFEVVLFDCRNHGWNAPSDPANHHYAQFVRDLDLIVHGVTAQLGPKTSVGAFHSLSARVAMLHAVDIGWRWDALVLFDPPTIPPPGHPLYEMMLKVDHRLTEWARNRRHRFTDPSELADEYKQLRAHQHWVEGAHELMARAILHQEEATGDWVLTCPGEIEAQIYLSNIPLNLWPHANQFGGPVKLIAADPTVERPGGPALTTQALARENGFAYTFIPGSGHMLQLEQPEATRREMLAFLTECGILR